MKILITGASGFIGRNLKEQFPETYNIFAPSSSKLNLLDENSVSEYLKKHSFDVVIHSATWDATSTSTKDLTKVLDHNLRMFFNLARRSDLFCKMIYFGSGNEFDREHWLPKMREDYFDTHVPKDQSGFSKYLMTKHAQRSSNIYNLRPFGVFGKYEDWRIRFISNAICHVIHDLPIRINQNVFFDYLYIDDLVKIVRWFVENNPANHIYNVCTGQVNDLKSLARTVLEVSRKNLPIMIKKGGLGREYSGDNSRLIAEVNNIQFSLLDNCIKELYAWYLSKKNSIDPQLL